MKKLFKSKKNRFIILLIVVVVVLIFIKIKNKDKQQIEINNLENNPTPTIFISPTVFPTLFEEKGDNSYYLEIQTERKDNYPLFEDVPYTTSSFRVNYIDDLTLQVTLKTDTPEIRQEVLDWISSKGVDPKSHTIIWKTP